MFSDFAHALFEGAESTPMPRATVFNLSNRLKCSSRDPIWSLQTGVQASGLNESKTLLPLREESLTDLPFWSFRVKSGARLPTSIILVPPFDAISTDCHIYIKFCKYFPAHFILTT